MMTNKGSKRCVAAVTAIGSHGHLVDSFRNISLSPSATTWQHDVANGRVHGQVVDRHRSREFIGVLRRLDGVYASGVKIRIILDSPSAHISRETRAYFATMPNRFEFLFMPKHGSWPNLIEMFFSKLARSMLRGIRVADKAELCCLS